MAGGRAMFLPRRMYENYLLDPAAVAAVMNGIENFRTSQVSEEEVNDQFEDICKQTKGGTKLQYFCSGITDVPMNWQREVDGARLLEATFAALSENRVQYEKMTHSIAITKWLLDNKPLRSRRLSIC
jgi:hypothetical protein